MKSIVLLSGGLDSAVCLAQAVKETEVVLCLTFDYGQRAAKKEIEASGKLARYYNLESKIIKVDFLKEITKTALVNTKEEVPKLNEEELDLPVVFETAAKVWVPNRNGVFINIAGAYAEAMDCQYIVTGYNAEEAVTFPDNSAEFLEAVNNSLFFSTANKTKVISYTLNLNKTQIVELGKKLDLPFEYIWSCYYGEEEMCGECESCQRLLRAKKMAKI